VFEPGDEDQYSCSVACREHFFLNKRSHCAIAYGLGDVLAADHEPFERVE